MAKKDELLAKLRDLAGTPQEMATVVGVETSNRTFQRAIKELTEDGTFVAEGTTKDRRYRNTNNTAANFKLTSTGPEEALLAAIPCLAREFSNLGNSLGLRGVELGALKHKLGIETVKGQDGRWYCRMASEAQPDMPARLAAERSPRQARICPKCSNRHFGDPAWVCPEHGVAVDQGDNTYFGRPPGVAQGRPDADKFAHMAAAAGRGGKTIGGKGKDQ